MGTVGTTTRVHLVYTNRSSTTGVKVGTEEMTLRRGNLWGEVHRSNGTQGPGRLHPTTPTSRVLWTHSSRHKRQYKGLGTLPDRVSATSS